jgi:Kef-type K+ transport system membrane component KefB
VEPHSVTFAFFLIFSGAAVLASIALYTRQPLIIAYIALGALIGPYGFTLVTDLGQLAEIGHVGIIFLLFLLGLDMQPQALLATLRKSTVVGLLSSAVFFGGSAGLAALFLDSPIDALMVGVAMMFSSTIIGIKLLPTTVLHHRHIGEMMVGLLLLQDLLAIIVLVLISAGGETGDVGAAGEILRVLLALPLLGWPPGPACATCCCR